MRRTAVVALSLSCWNCSGQGDGDGTQPCEGMFEDSVHVEYGQPEPVPVGGLVVITEPDDSLPNGYYQLTLWCEADPEVQTTHITSFGVLARGLPHGEPFRTDGGLYWQAFGGLEGVQVEVKPVETVP